MQPIHDVLLLLVVLTNFWVLGTTRLSATIRATAVQGMLLAGLPIALYPRLRTAHPRARDRHLRGEGAAPAVPVVSRDPGGGSAPGD